MPSTRDSTQREHGAWLDFCQELEYRGIHINERENDPLACAVRKWGEELHQLRLAVPHYDTTALEEKRHAYVGRFEQGTYPNPGHLTPETRRREAIL